MKNTLTLVAFLLSAIQACGQQAKRLTDYHYRESQTCTDSLLTGELSAVGMDSSIIVRLTKTLLSDSIPNVHSLLVMKDDLLVYEQYFPGKDQKHGKKLGYIDHAVDQLHDCRSISKSIVAACIGIALKQKFIQSIDEPIRNYFREIKDSLKGTITIKHLLTMTSGLKWNELGSYGSIFNSETRMDLAFNPVKYILRRKLVARPGMVWTYSAGNTQLLAEIIHRATGLNIAQFADQFLFRPLGIHKFEWVDLTFKHISAAASGLRLTSRDLLKFGRFLMNEGNWEGQQILDSVWVKQSFTSFIQRPDLHIYQIKDGGYGYQFWTYDGGDIVEAKGNGGQSIFVCKSLKLLVVTTGGNYNKADSNPYLILTKYIVPAILSK